MEKYNCLFVFCVLASFCINASVRAPGIQVQTNSSINELMNEGCIFGQRVLFARSRDLHRLQTHDGMPTDGA